MHHVLGDSSDDECDADLQKMLKMGIGILRCLPTKWALLHHIDDGGLKLNVTISDIHLWSSPNIGIGWSRKVINALPSGHKHWLFLRC
jgi:hypothetical protein